MLFSSLEFLYAFFPLTLLLYFAVPAKWKNLVLVVMSLGFYFYGEQFQFVLMVVSIAVSYIGGRLIARHRNKWILVAGVAIHLGLLFVYKYADFTIANINAIFGLGIPQPHLALPIGISFYTFQSLSYMVDVYRGTVAVQKSPIKLAAYVSFFPQLVAGPIVRYSHVEKELTHRVHSLDLFAQGAMRFAAGLGKKILIANILAQLVNAFRDTAEHSVLFFWMYALAFMLHLYFDFSGYSDMAIGLGKMTGFHFPENFNYPFAAESISDFWRRWHMTLGSWFRDYVYFPLGGSRVGKKRLIFNLFVVWMLTGLWHGAAWTFVIWGLFFGVLLVFEKMVWGKALERAPRFFRHLYTMLLVLISFVIFDATSLADAAGNIAGLFGIGASGLVDAVSLYYLRSYAPILIAAILLSLPLWDGVKKSKKAFLLRPIAMAALIVVCTAFLVDGSFNPFLYFRF